MKKLSGLAILFFPVLAQAHAGHGDSNSFMQGFLHPLMGLDHLLVLGAIGVWLASMAHRTRVTGIMALAGVTFMAMTFGRLLPALHDEWSLVATLVVVPAFLVVSKRWFSGLGFCVIALSVALHGVAHGAELAGQGVWWQVSLATVLSSSLILAIIAQSVSWLRTRILLRTKSA